MTAAVVGVILNLAIWFAIHVIWREVMRVEAGPLSLRTAGPGVDGLGRGGAVGAWRWWRCSV